MPVTPQEVEAHRRRNLRVAFGVVCLEIDRALLVKSPLDGSIRIDASHVPSSVCVEVQEAYSKAGWRVDQEQDGAAIWLVFSPARPRTYREG